MLETRYYLGLDLAQVSDYNALVALRREREIPEPFKPRAATHWHELELPKPPAPPSPSRYYGNIVERFQLGLSYTTLVDVVRAMFLDPGLAGQTLVVDGTGVGRPVVDLFRKAKINCRLMPVTITGSAVSAALGKVNVDEWGYWHVPKKELVGCVQVLLGTGRLEVAPTLPHAATLVHELKNFHYKINTQTAHVSYENWRDAEHDDMVLAASLAAWAGERATQELWVR